MKKNPSEINQCVNLATYFRNLRRDLYQDVAWAEFLEIIINNNLIKGLLKPEDALTKSGQIVMNEAMLDLLIPSEEYHVYTNILNYILKEDEVLTKL